MDARDEKMHRQPLHARQKLVAIKVLHTVIWALIVACIVALPFLGARHHLRAAAVAAGIVLGECGLLVLCGWRCPMTLWAARYTEERQANFDIYLPEWLARRNKAIFSILFIFNMILLLIEIGKSGTMKLP